MYILFEDYDKKFKSSFLKELENNVKIVKNVFDIIFVNCKGITYSLENKLDNGRVFCKTTLHEIFNIPDSSLLKLDLNRIVECLKAGKSKILGFCVDKDDGVILKTTELDYVIGEIQEEMKLNMDYIEDIVDNVEYRCNLNELLDKFNNKEFINIKKDKYDLILTHKLFPSINKSTNFTFEAKDNNNGTFYGVFRNTIEEKNKKEEVVFSIDVIYIYRFLFLN